MTDRLIGKKQPINVGDKVRWLTNGEVVGEVVEVTVVRYLDIVDGKGEPVGTIAEDAVEIAPPLEPGQSWAQAAIIAVELVSKRHTRGVVVPLVHRGIRQELYSILGAGGVKITPEVKREVRRIIKRVAQFQQVDVMED